MHPKNYNGSAAAYPVNRRPYDFTEDDYDPYSPTYSPTEQMKSRSHFSKLSTTRGFDIGHYEPYARNHLKPPLPEDRFKTPHPRYVPDDRRDYPLRLHHKDFVGPPKYYERDFQTVSPHPQHLNSLPEFVPIVFPDQGEFILDFY